MRPVLVLAFAVAALSASAQPGPPPAAGQQLDGIAAVVGEQVILHSEVDALVTQLSQGRPAPPELWSRALDRLVNQRIVIDRARADTTLNVTDAIVSQQVERQVAQLTMQAGGQEALTEYYGRSLEEIKALFREDVRDQVLLQQYQGRRLREVTVTPGEVRAWFEQIPAAERPLIPELVRVAHIVRVPEADAAGRAAVRATADALRDSVVSGLATIEALADRYSDDPGNTNTDGTQNGGLYTTLRLSDLEPRFRAAAASGEIGAISPVFETPFGYHFMRVNERDGERISFNHVLLTVETGAGEIEAARDFLTVLRDSVLAGRPFEVIAREHSQDPISALRGGYVAAPDTRQRDINPQGLGPSWQATLDTLEVGEISMPSEVQLFDGTTAQHIVLLQRRTPEHTLSVTDDYELLSQYALQDKQNVVLADWVDDLRRVVYVDIKADRYQPPAGG